MTTLKTPSFPLFKRGDHQTKQNTTKNQLDPVNYHNNINGLSPIKNSLFFTQLIQKIADNNNVGAGDVLGETVTFFRTWRRESNINLDYSSLFQGGSQNNALTSNDSGDRENSNHPLDSFISTILFPPSHVVRPNPITRDQAEFTQFGMIILNQALSDYYSRKIALAQSDNRAASFIANIRQEQSMMQDGFSEIQRIMRSNQGMTTAQAISEYERSSSRRFSAVLQEINPHLVELIETEDGRSSGQGQLRTIQQMMGEDRNHYLDQVVVYSLNELDRNHGRESSQNRGLGAILTDVVSTLSIGADDFIDGINVFEENNTLHSQIAATRAGLQYYEVIGETLGQFWSVEGGLIMIATTLIGLYAFRTAQVGILMRLGVAGLESIPIGARILGTLGGLGARFVLENGSRFGMQALYQQIDDPELGRALTFDRAILSLPQNALSMIIGMSFDRCVQGIVGESFSRSACAEGFSDMFENWGCEIFRISDLDTRPFWVRFTGSMLGGFGFEGMMRGVHVGGSYLLPSHANTINGMMAVEQGRSTAESCVSRPLVGRECNVKGKGFLISYKDKLQIFCLG